MHASSNLAATVMAAVAVLAVTFATAPAQAPVASADPSISSDPDIVAPPSPTPSVTAGPDIRWTRLPNGEKHPSAREDHTLTVDPDGTAAYLFGGRTAGGAALDDLWRLDLDADTWQRLAPNGAARRARFGHTSTWVPGVGLAVWSGQSKQSFFDDLWVFEPVLGQWHRVRTGGPIPRARFGSCAALGPDGRLWISHGFTDDLGRFDDTWAFDFAGGRWTDETPEGRVPGRRCLHDCTFTPDGRLLLYGGQTTGVPALGDVWTRPIDGTWDKGPDPEPAARQLYGLASDGNDAYVFGGADLQREPLRDLWHLDLTTLDWTELDVASPRPKARSGASMVVDDQRSRVILFGGRAGSTAFDDLWSFPTTSASADDSPGPSPAGPGPDASLTPGSPEPS